ncbi:hypothetical protein [Paenibacillus sp. MMS18-CY102]|uniref:hypothetical protein n=1 Tax=Paenibacillus sp. MMS18-CY102 TaxID=2682849 RepID=UPI0013666DD2|nr:hypothetical protein [Paenibacillus sp. MMS18-CY102]MWC30762.1 hypothetical protein [Paenibacillus sp. MMS18-CY102]
MGKKSIMIAVSILIVLTVAVGLWCNPFSNTGPTEAALTEEEAAKLIPTTPTNEINILSLKPYNDGLLVFYLDAPKSATAPQDFKHTDIGFAYLVKGTGGQWKMEHSGEYGSIDAYLKKSGHGYTGEFFPSDKEGFPSIMFGIMSDPQITGLKMADLKTGEDLPVFYDEKDGLKVWHAFMEKPYHESYILSSWANTKKLYAQVVRF